MGAMLDALRQLQEIELHLNEYRAKEESYRRQARSAQRQIEKRLAEGEAHRQQVKNCQMEIDQADLDIKAREEAMDKHRQALNASKSNKEYAAILTALNTEKADSSKCESRVLELMAKKEELLAQSAEFDAEREKLNERLQRQQANLTAYLEEIAEDFKALERQRDEAAEDLPPSALQTFRRLAQRHEGEAMAEAIRITSRGDEHICGGCNMSVPLEVINRLISRDEIVLCATCGRILHHNPATVST